MQSIASAAASRSGPPSTTSIVPRGPAACTTFARGADAAVAGVFAAAWSCVRGPCAAAVLDIEIMALPTATIDKMVAIFMTISAGMNTCGACARCANALPHAHRIEEGREANGMNCVNRA